jgi:hypothetical protein
MDTNTELPEGFEIRELPTGGRPKRSYFIKGKEVSKEIWENKLSPPVQLLRPKGMDAESFSEFCRLAVPDLVQRMYELAKQSEDIRAIQIVAKELADRGYGRATQAVQVTHSTIESAWDKADNVIDVVEEKE